MEASSQVSRKLQAYKRRFYLNLVLKGSLISLFISLATWVLAISLTYFGHLGVGWRTSLFFSVVVGVGLVLGWLVIRPLFQLSGILKQKSDEESAMEIGSAMEEVDDRLSNYLNLKLAANKDPLALAGVNQKASQLDGHNFTSVVDLRQNIRWVWWTLAPVSVMLLLFFFRPDVLREGSNQLVKYGDEFTTPAPFVFSIKNEALQVNENADYILQVSATGPSIPSVAFVTVNDTRFRLKQNTPGEFTYTFKNVRESLPFMLSSGDIETDEFLLRVLPAPKLTNLEVNAAYPAYTQRGKEQFKNRSTIRVPEGTVMEWNASMNNVANATLLRNGMDVEMDALSKDQVAWVSSAIANQTHILSLKNEHELEDSVRFIVEVIPDGFPVIEVAESTDSSAFTTRFFGGEISDDYGLSKLEFIVEHTTESGSPMSKKTFVPIAKGLQQQAFNFYWNFDSVKIAAGDKLEYYFLIYDNDGVNGAKFTRSQTWSYDVPDRESLSEQTEQVSQNTKSSSKQNLEEFKKIDEELERLKSELLQKKQPEWEDRERLKELLEKQKKIMKDMQQKTQQQQQQNSFEQKLKEYPQELMDKQRQIEDMFEKLFDEEFKEKWKEMNELMEKMNKSKMLEQLEEMKLDNESLEKELDRTLELFKQLEFEKKLEDQIQEAEELAKEMEELSEKSADKKSDLEDLKKEQERLDDKLEQFEKGMEDLEKKNSELEEPQKMPDTSEEQDEANEQMDQSDQNLDQGKQKKAGENQKNASDAMKKMGEKMKSMQEQSAQDQQSENLEDLQQLLENVVTLSKDQEQLMADIKAVKLNDPKYTMLSKEQKRLIDDSKVVEDSLVALSKRVVQLDKVITKELTSVQSNMDKALDLLTNQPPNQQEQYKAKASERQQYVMTSLNNLALLLDEVMQQMQSQMKQQMQKGDGACKKPGQGSKPSPSAGDLRKMQQNLNKQLEQLKKAMEKGQKPNGKKPGDKPGQQPGMGGMAKDVARMAAQQSAIREQLRELSDALGGDESGEAGKGAAQQLKELERMMEQTEEELLYRKISQQTIERQQDILTRLLESEKAERERDLDEKRESKTAFEEYEVPQDIWEKFMQEKAREMELYETTPPDLKPFYKKRVNSYFSTLSR